MFYLKPVNLIIQSRTWHEAGRRVKKKNTFHDTIACAEYLVQSGYCHSSKLAIQGTSAGGLAVGYDFPILILRVGYSTQCRAVLNMRPDLFTAAIANVPWLDVVTDGLVRFWQV